MSEPVFAEHIGDWRGPWIFASPEETTQRLEVASFVEIGTWLQSQPVTLPDAATYRSYLETVVFNQHLDRLTTQSVADTSCHTLDYWRSSYIERRLCGQWLD